LLPDGRLLIGVWAIRECRLIAVRTALALRPSGVFPPEELREFARGGPEKPDRQGET